MAYGARTTPGHAAWYTGWSAASAVVFLVSLLVWTLSNLDQSIFGYVLPGILVDFHRPLATAGMILAISFVVS